MSTNNSERSIKELLQVMLDNFDLFFDSGLCRLTNKLLNENIITYEEEVVIIEFIRNNRPKRTWLSPITNPHLNPSSSGYFWGYGERLPRVQWLNKHISKLSRRS